MRGPRRARESGGAHERARPVRDWGRGGPEGIVLGGHRERGDSRGRDGWGWEEGVWRPSVVG